jgi:hypothetical protein
MPWRKGPLYAGVEVPPMWFAFYIGTVMVQRRPNGWCYKDTGRWLRFGDKDLTIDQVIDKIRG